MGDRATRIEAAEVVLALAAADKDGEFILRQYAIVKHGDDELMQIEGDRKDLVADTVADLHYLDRNIEALPGFDKLEASLASYCGTQNFDYEDLKRRGNDNAEYELGPVPVSPRL